MSKYCRAKNPLRDYDNVGCHGDEGHAGLHHQPYAGISHTRWAHNAIEAMNEIRVLRDAIIKLKDESRASRKPSKLRFWLLIASEAAETMTVLATQLAENKFTDEKIGE